MWKSQWAGQTEFPDLFWQNWAQMVKDMNKAGVPLMVGTDLMCPGLIPGYSVHEEMAIWQEAGIPPADVLRSATVVRRARFMGMEVTASARWPRARPLRLVLGQRAIHWKIFATQRLIDGVFLRGTYYDRT